ncbi:DUF4390 domain-containing protein [Comamonas flocculans]|uniref:DUF4390 domain-containing protein n=1 Tax=Comamonas flocculans TaxID=2597701 RepID=A0A5B8S054_9BURK|nr:DUF4390 domain-containing protein [Comamonas flocculans]QEA14494.1 DUF4390 domain-containing protein [Comamonas flocculans]
MPCCTRRRLDAPRPCLRARAVLAALLWCVGSFAGAQTAAAPGALQLQVQRDAQGVYLSALLPLQLQPAVQDALLKGIAMHFTAEAQILSPRWYWSDKLVAEARRYLRLSYQPLTRRWRLVQSPEPISPSGLGIVLGQNYDSLPEALASMQRVSRWQVAEAEALQDDASYTLRFHYRLDTSQLPRPLQWGTVGGANWSLHLQGSAAVPPLGAPAPEAPPVPAQGS